MQIICMSEIPCARVLTQEEIDAGYEKNTGTVIIETFEGKRPDGSTGCPCKNHGPFAWARMQRKQYITQSFWKGSQNGIIHRTVKAGCRTRHPTEDSGQASLQKTYTMPIMVIK